MKELLTLSFVFALLTTTSFAGSPNEEPGNRGESTRLSLYIPGFLVKAAAGFMDEKDRETKDALKNLRSISITVREGNAYKEYFAKRYEKKMEKLERQHFENLVSVRDADEKVSIQLRVNRKDKIRQVAIIADDGNSEFVFLRVRCNVTQDDLQEWLGATGISGHNPGTVLSTSL